MDLITENMADLENWWQWALSISDPRVKDWLLMDSPLPTAALTAIYLLVVWQGPKFMANRQPLVTSTAILFIYNALLVVLNFHIFYELVVGTWKAGYSYSCQPVNYTTDENEMRIAKALWWYYFSKLVEFLDTIFFILRKKDNQVSFLHVYHHATMFPLWWIGVKWVAGGQSFFGAMINSFIHVVMYTYYGISSLGPQYQKYVWWKKYLTRMQLIQFAAGITHAAQSIAVSCDYPLWIQWALVAYAFSIMLLFLNFYFYAYIKPSRPKVAANGEHTSYKPSTAANGHSNGLVANGHANHMSNGHAKHE